MFGRNQNCSGLSLALHQAAFLVRLGEPDWVPEFEPKLFLYKISTLPTTLFLQFQKAS